jgi:hypothetical protein
LPFLQKNRGDDEGTPFVSRTSYYHGVSQNISGLVTEQPLLDYITYLKQMNHCMEDMMTQSEFPTRAPCKRKRDWAQSKRGPCELRERKLRISRFDDAGDGHFLWAPPLLYIYTSDFTKKEWWIDTTKDHNTARFACTVQYRHHVWGAFTVFTVGRWVIVLIKT